MRKIDFLPLILLSAALLLSCEGRVEQPARDILAGVRSQLEAGNYNSAKILIDSIKRAHPKAYKTLLEAETLRREVLVKEKERDVAFFDEELNRLLAKRDAMLESFVYSKNSKYQDVGVYSLPSQAISANAHNCFLRATVNELGEAFITSYYRGKRIGYKSVCVRNGESYVTAENALYSWTGKEFGVYVERRDYKRGNDGGIMEFVASAGNAPLTVELSGANGSYSYTLREQDAQAIAQVVALSDVLISIAECRSMRDSAQYSLDFLLKGEQRLKRDTVIVE